MKNRFEQRGTGRHFNWEESSVYIVTRASAFAVFLEVGFESMGNELKKKYGLITAIAMVVGIVIGSGVFFKATKVLLATGGNLPLGILAWAIGGLIMIVCAYTFSILANKYEKVNGLIAYAEAALGPKYGYMMGWFLTTIFYPCMCVPIAWLGAKYACSLFGLPGDSAAALTLTAVFLILSFAINALAPILAGKIQVSTTIIKLVPLLLMAIVGTIVGLFNGMTVENMTTVVTNVDTGSGLFAAVVATAFAYEGWIIATSINAELKDAKKNLPRALIFGTALVAVVYILYYIGLAGSVSSQTLMENGDNGVILAFETLFSKSFGTILIVFIIISCLGALNGMMLGCSRGMYSIAARKLGPAPEVFGEVDDKTGTPVNSSIIALLICSLWLLYFYASQLADPCWFGNYWFDITELPIVTVYAAYIPIFLRIVKREKELSVFKRYFVPVVAIGACCFMVFAGVAAHGITVVWYLIVFVMIMLAGLFFLLRNQKRDSLVQRSDCPEEKES